MNILVLNLRDIANPSAGGAEVFTHEISKNWVKSGNQVTIIAAKFKGSPVREVIDGVNIIRLGNNLTVYLLAKYFVKKYQDQYDIIIDEYTCRPFLAPTFVKKPIIFLVHEVAREKYFYELPPVLSHIFYYYFEPSWLKKYLNVRTVTVSDSTKQDLLDFGFHKIDVVPEGINFNPLNDIPEKEEEPIFLFVGLLKKLNLVDHVIEAFKLISKELPTAKLWIVGRGKERDKLEKMAENLNVNFFGYVSEEKKLELMSKAHAILVPAVREGWGLVVTEANACGTPAIGYRVHGLKDSIKDKDTGILTENNSKALAEAVIEFFKNSSLRNQMTENSLEWSKSFSWTNTSDCFLQIMEREINDHKENGFNNNPNIQLSKHFEKMFRVD